MASASRTASAIGSARSKSISATNAGSTSAGWVCHLWLFRFLSVARLQRPSIGSTGGGYPGPVRGANKKVGPPAPGCDDHRMNCFASDDGTEHFSWLDDPAWFTAAVDLFVG